MGQSTGTDEAKVGAVARGLGLFAASARNLAPRLTHASAVAAGAFWFIGPIWTGVWALAVAVNLGLSVLQARLYGREGGRNSAALKRFADLNGLFGSILHSIICIAIFRSGYPMAEAFALASVFVCAAYVLLQYYADVALFRMLVLPYWATMAYMAFELALRAGPSAGFFALAGAALMMGNFFHLSRRQLHRSRSALREAREAARRGELAAEAANAAKSTFLATMSHEIRTPLNGVLGMAQAMAYDELSSVQRERLAVIHRSGESLLAILNDVLDLSKIEAGKLELECVEFDLGEVARGAYSAFTALANKKGLSFALDIEAARGRYQGDPTRLRQILYNLISNALKFTEQGEIRVRGSYEDGELCLTVSDTGVGISPENLGRLFGKFDQLDSSMTRRFGGTGLGLSICRQLVELMGGEISVESAMGRGSTFCVRLPLALTGDAKPAGQLPPSPPGPQLGEAALKVLAAEDNVVNQLVLKTLLHQLGVEPVVVENGEAAVEAWASSDWDVILMDIQMPGMDGLTATAAIRAGEAASGRSRTPIVALTANAMAHQIEQYYVAGMDAHVAKPIEAAALFETLCGVTEAATLMGAEASDAALRA